MAPIPTVTGQRRVDLYCLDWRHVVAVSRRRRLL